MKKIFRTSEWKIDASGKSHVTEKLQALIDETAREQGILLLEKGIYLTAPLFLKSNMELRFEDGAVLRGTTEEERWHEIPTRVAGIEMEWYPGILNCDGQEHVTISGNGIVDGQGEYWWEKYWGKDRCGGLRAEYEKKGIRWASDYDCMRARNVLVSNSSDITIQNLTSVSSGFWNFHILYSHQVHIDGVKVTACTKVSPSTDGIDIDSCEDVLVENCEISCNDDNICIKSGRDADGLRVKRPCKNITIQNCKMYEGFGVTIGSELSGGVSGITLKNLTYRGTDCGFRIKSSELRKGYVKDISIDGFDMENVKYLFHIYLDWNRAYSICKIPDNYKGTVPERWKTLLDTSFSYLPNTSVENITVKNVRARMTEDYTGISRAFHMEGYEDMPLRHLSFCDMDILCRETGIIEYAEDICFENVKISVLGKRDAANDVYDNE